MSLKVPVATLRIFDAAARSQSFHAAAQELGLTPSAVSHAIRRMEESLGIALFEREGRSLRLTASGETLKAQAQCSAAKRCHPCPIARVAALGRGHGDDPGALPPAR